MRYLLLVLSFMLVGCGVQVAAGQVALRAYEDAEAYAVYSVMLKDEWPVRVGKAAQLVIQAETTDFPSFGDSKTKCLAPPQGEEAVYAPVIASYTEANKTPWLLQGKFDSSIPFEIVSKVSLNSIFDKKGVDGWKDFYQKYPNSGGQIYMSAVGFNADKTLAIVYMGHSCGGLCGGGTYHVLKKTGGKWGPIQWNGITCDWAS